MLKIGVDIDGVLTREDSISVWEKELTEYYNLKKKKGDLLSLKEKYELDMVEMINFYEDCTGKIASQIKAKKEACKFMKSISKNNSIYIITARTKTEHTKKWLYENNIDYDHLIHSHKKDLICNKYDIDIHIEDSPNIANLIAENTSTTVYLLETAYNKDADLNSKVYKVRNLKEVQKIIKGVVFHGNEQRW